MQSAAVQAAALLHGGDYGKACLSPEPECRRVLDMFFMKEQRGGNAFAQGYWSSDSFTVLNKELKRW